MWRFVIARAFPAFILSFISLAAVVQAQTPFERGRYLVEGVVACGNCHTQQGPAGPVEGMALAGGLDVSGPWGKVISPNITPDPETGIGTWSADDIKRAIRDGLRPDGSLIGPPMPFHFYRSIADEDLDAIVTYLQSVPAIRNETPAPEFAMPLPTSYGPPVVSVAKVSRDDLVAYGEYLAGPLGHCMECHSSLDANGMPDPENGLGGGGIPFEGPWGISYAANLTPTGLSGYSDTEIKTIIRTGVRPDGSHLLPPMGVYYYNSVSEEDLDAIVAYLRSLPPK